MARRLSFDQSRSADRCGRQLQQALPLAGLRGVANASSYTRAGERAAASGSGEGKKVLTCLSESSSSI